MSESTQSVAHSCGHCQTAIAPQSRFCDSCGQPLFEQCSCGADVLLNQAFCNQCGCNLAERLQVRREQARRLIMHAGESAGKGDYDAALRLLQRINLPKDYRFDDLRKEIGSKIDQYTGEQEKWRARAEQALELAKVLAEQGQHRKLIQVAEAVPAGMRPDALKKLLDVSQTRLQTEQRLRQQLQAALDSRAVEEALVAAHQLYQLKPDSTRRRKQLETLVEQARTLAKRLAGGRRFEKALAVLQAIPSEFKSNDDQRLESTCHELGWLLRMAQRVSVISPQVLKLLEKLKQRLPQSDVDQQLKKRVKEAIRAHAKSPSALALPMRERLKVPEVGCPIYPVRLPPGCIQNGSQLAMRQGAQLFIACGAAVQGANAVLPDAAFVEQRRRGLFAFKHNKPQRSAWGLDIGTRFVKAVKVERQTDGQLVVTAAEAVDLGPEVIGYETRRFDALKRAVEELLQRTDLGNGPVWVNYPATGAFARSVLLPPNTGDKSTEFLRQEAHAKIPVPADQLELAYWVAPESVEQGATVGTVIGVRRDQVQSRRDLLRSLGLNIAGMLLEPFCLLVARQFCLDALEKDCPVDAEGQADDGLCDLWLEIGLQQTLLVISSPRAMWTRCIQWGINGLAANISKRLKLNQEQALLVADNPFIHSGVGEVAEAIQERIPLLNRDIRLSIRSAESVLGRLNIGRMILVGGGAYHPLLVDWLAENDL